MGKSKYKWTQRRCTLQTCSSANENAHTVDSQLKLFYATNCFSAFLSQGLLSHKPLKQHSSITATVFYYNTSQHASTKGLQASPVQIAYMFYISQVFRTETGLCITTEDRLWQPSLSDCRQLCWAPSSCSRGSAQMPLLINPPKRGDKLYLNFKRSFIANSLGIPEFQP